MNIPTMPNLSIKRTVSNGKVMEMVEMDEYATNPDRYLGRSDVGIVVRPEEYDGQELVLPLRPTYNGNPITPGVYNAGAIDYTVLPGKDKYKDYIPDKIVELGNNMDAKQIIESGEALSRLDEPFITTPENITRIPINTDDQPEMKALKMALNEKKMDLDKYAGRFGPNFPNDKRQLKNDSITLNIIKRFCDNMDMEAILTIRDKGPDVPNPIGKEIVVSLTDEYVNEDSE